MSADLVSASLQTEGEQRMMMVVRQFPPQGVLQDPGHLAVSVGLGLFWKTHTCSSPSCDTWKWRCVWETYRSLDQSRDDVSERRQICWCSSSRPSSTAPSAPVLLTCSSRQHTGLPPELITFHWTLNPPSREWLSRCPPGPPGKAFFDSFFSVSTFSCLMWMMLWLRELCSFVSARTHIKTYDFRVSSCRSSALSLPVSSLFPPPSTQTNLHFEPLRRNQHEVWHTGEDATWSTKFRFKTIFSCRTIYLLNFNTDNHVPLTLFTLPNIKL